MGTFETAMVEHRAGNTLRAKKLYERVVSQTPSHAQAWYCLGVLAMQAKRHDDAVTLFQSSIRWNARNPAAFSNLGEVLRRLGRPEEAAAALRAAVALEPSIAELHHNLGLALAAAGHLPAAIASYEGALARKPELLPVVASWLIEALRAAGRSDEAVARHASWGSRAPRTAETELAAGGALSDVYRLDEAVEHLRTALGLAPDSGPVEANLGVALLDRGDIDDAVRHLGRAVELGAPGARSNLLYALSFHPEVSSEELRGESVRLCRELTANAPPRRIHANDRSPDRRLRIGYVSGDFRRHVALHFLLPLLSHHDRESFRIHCYSCARQSDEWTARFRDLAHEFRDVSALDDDAMERLVAEDEIDVLVDLSMHTAHNRLSVFARKPAPVQISWLAYPGSTGLETIDHRLTDAWFDPETNDDVPGPESPFRLAATFWCWDPLDAEPPVGPLPALAEGRITFGCFNNFRKVSARALEVWASALHAVPASRILLVAPRGHARQRVVSTFHEFGVTADRIEFVGHLPRPEYLALYHRVDVSLDPLPSNGGATSLDSFWMGVPVLSPLGDTVAGRAGLSLAMNLGLPELSTPPGEFGARARELTADLPRLAALRASLRERLRGSPLMDAPRFAEHVEQAYRTLFQRWCSSAITPRQ